MKVKCDMCGTNEAVVFYHRSSGVDLFYCYECAIRVREDMRKQLVQIVKAIRAWEKYSSIPTIKWPDELTHTEPQTS